MIRGLYTAGTGMNTQMKKLDVISNNLANVNTTGFKKDTTVVSAFPEVLMTKINDTKNNNNSPTPIGRVSLGARVDEVYTNFSQGSFIKTDSTFDIAIQGDGFFVLNTPNGQERYTRDGAFVIDANGQLRSQEGNAVMGTDGPIQLDDEFLTQSHQVFIDDVGRIIIDGEYINTIRIASFEDNGGLQKVGDNLYQGNGNPAQFNGKIMQGFLESANVNPVIAMVDMITVSRTYEANQKMIQVHDTLMGKAVNEVGKV